MSVGAKPSEEEVRTWTIYACKCGDNTGDHNFVCANCGRAQPVEVVRASALEAVEGELGRLREALQRFVNMADRWEEQNEQSWDDAEEEAHPEGEWGPEWFAEMEVCNRDVLNARSVLAPGREADRDASRPAGRDLRRGDE